MADREDDVERQVEKPRPAERSVHAIFYIAYVNHNGWRSRGTAGVMLIVGSAMQELDLFLQLDHSFQQMDH